MKKEIQDEFNKAEKEIGIDKFDKHHTTVFDKPCLDFVKTIVINLPESCYANCSYCIDKEIRKHAIDVKTFLETCRKTFDEFPDIKEISITGGSLKAKDFNTLLDMINKKYPNITITWNTNAINIDEQYNIDSIKWINLHRNSVDEKKNAEMFCSNYEPISIESAKQLFGNKLCLRITIDEKFNLDEYVKLGIPLYLNQMLPGNEQTTAKYMETLNNLHLQDCDYRRRNVYLNTIYNGITIRVCVGDKMASHVPGRYPIYLNVAIIHRSGIVCGSWYEDDKTLYIPNENEII